MILRYSLFERLPFLFALLAANLSQAKTDFDCKPKIDGKTYDFTGLSKEPQQLNRTRLTPPSTTIDSLTFDLCHDLVPQEGVPNHDRCPFDTRACLTQINVKDDNPRIISVIPLGRSKLEGKVTLVPDTPAHLLVVLEGGDYPEESKEETTPPKPQSLHLTLWCEPDKEPTMKFLDYDGSQLKVEHFGKEGCPVTSDGDKPGDDKKPEDGKGETGSGIGWFFFMLLLVFMAYFGIGAYYNYSTYGARGLDLIPHRDFWQEVPYMLRDVASHLCSSAKPRSRTSRNGYIQV